MAKHHPTVSTLRLEAQLAYLDGRLKRARELNKRADVMSAIERALYDLGLAACIFTPKDRIAELQERVRQG